MRLASRLQFDRVSDGPSSGTEAGAVLLEVVLALALFVGAATVLTSGLSSSLEAVERLRLSTHAADLAVSVLSELQMGIKSPGAGGAQPFAAPFEQWTWEIVSVPLQTEWDESSVFKQVEVVIRHEDSPLVYRLGQVLQINESAPASGTSSEADSF